MARRLIVALCLAGVAYASWIVLRDSGASADDLWTLPMQYHIMALGMVVADVIMRAARFVIIAGAVGAPLALSHAVSAQLAGDGAAAVTPARSGSDPAKAVVLTRAGLSTRVLGAVLVGELLSEAILAVPFSLALVGFGAPWFTVLGPATWSVLGVALVGAVWLALRKARGLLRWNPWRVKGTWVRGAVRSARHVRKGIAALRTMSRRAVGGVVVVTLAHMVFRVAVMPVLVGPEAFMREPGALLGWPQLFLYGGSLVPAPGGAGLVELGIGGVMENVLGGSAGVIVLWWRFYTAHLTALAGLALLGLAALRTFAPAPVKGRVLA